MPAGRDVTVCCDFGFHMEPRAFLLEVYVGAPMGILHCTSYNGTAPKRVSVLVRVVGPEGWVSGMLSATESGTGGFLSSLKAGD